MSYIPIGVIVNTHGLKGTLKVKSFTDFKEERYQSGQTLYIDYKGSKIPVTVVSFQTQKGIELLQFKEFNDINDCEKYKGSDLLIAKDDIHSLDEGEYYFDELIGMTVQGDTITGVVTNVREVPRGALLEVEINGKQILIPFHKEFILDVDKKNNTIHINEWEGLV
jgi:16S rRNA processing protein RimM